MAPPKSNPLAQRHPRPQRSQSTVRFYRLARSTHCTPINPFKRPSTNQLRTMMGFSLLIRFYLTLLYPLTFLRHKLLFSPPCCVRRKYACRAQDIITGWGESVSCAKPQTSPRYGFFVNGLSVLLLLGGGIISLFKTYSSHRDLEEAVEMWKNDRAEVAEMQSRLAMIRKKEEYAAAVASAAASAAESPPVIFKSRRSVTSSVAEPAAPAAVPAPEGASTCARSSRFAAHLERVVSLSPPSPREISSVAGTPAAGPRERHMRKTSTVAFAPVDLEHGEDTRVGKIAVPRPQPFLESPCLPILEGPCLSSPESDVSSVETDVEHGAGAAAAGASAGLADIPEDEDGEAASDDPPPPQGWEVRTTPSGDK